MRRLAWLSVFLVSYSCTVEPQSIRYGQDHCSFCKMTIVDNRYASQLVTTKGKAFKFDAIECLINYQVQNPSDTPPAFLLITDFSRPAHLTDASQAFFVRSARLPSPMGMYITGFRDRQKAEAIADELQGELYSWNQLKAQFEQLPNLTQSEFLE